MPLRNLILVAITALVSFACYNVAAKNRNANLFADAIELVEREALHPLESDQLLDAAMNGMLGKLDEYSQFLNANEYRDFRDSIQQEFSGVGINFVVNPESKRLVVLTTVFGSPAFESDVKIGDEIIAVDGRDVTPLSRDEIIDAIRGVVGTSVKLTVVRDSATIDIVVVRARINTESVHGDFRQPDGNWQFMLQDYPGIGYLRIDQFSDKTAEEVSRAILQHQTTLNGLIIDLRNNGGGLLDKAIEVCDMFVEKGKLIVSTRRRDGAMIETLATKQPIVPVELPMVVLMNRYSASASEIVAGCLQDHQRATIIGEQSFGKGTVQNLVPMQRRRSALKLTTASYWRPNGKPIDRKDAAVQQSKNWGVIPNEGFSIAQTEEELILAVRYRNFRDMRFLLGGDQTELLNRLNLVPNLGRSTADAPGPENDSEVDSTIAPSPDLSPSPQTDQTDQTTNRPLSGDAATPPSHPTTELFDPTLQRAIEFLKQKMQQQEKAA